MEGRLNREVTCPDCMGKGRLLDYEAEGIISAVPQSEVSALKAELSSVAKQLEAVNRGVEEEGNK